MLESFAFKVSIDCRACRISIPLNGIVGSSRCYHCGETNTFDQGFWADVFRFRRFTQAMEWAPGAMAHEGSADSGLRVEWGRSPVKCGRCAALVGGASACPSCGASIRARAADDALRAIYAPMRFVMHETAPDENGQSLQAARAPVVFQCMSCGGGLKVNGSARLVSCEFCKADNYLPDGLWQMLHPVPKPEVFYLLCEVETVEERRIRAAQRDRPASEFATLAKDPDLDVRRAVAANTGAPNDVLQKLAFDKHRAVLEALAQNPSIPERIVAQMADSDDAEFRFFAVRNPQLSHEQLRKLAKTDPDPRVRQAAHARIEELRAQGAKIGGGGILDKLFGD